ncbi:unnamed protein product [Spirodela intermedia]|uniref:Uncharacterized protein n=1 Tax=Spirodela intermedia TaxID=51605 RepID=A0A7I8KAS6_SPIIN|nr:unnamed protein product [Spirodela intermedia]
MNARRLAIGGATVGGRAAAGDGHGAVLSGHAAAGDRRQRWSVDERDEELRACRWIPQILENALWSAY